MLKCAEILLCTILGCSSVEADVKSPFYAKTVVVVHTRIYRRLEVSNTFGLARSSVVVVSCGEC